MFKHMIDIAPFLAIMMIVINIFQLYYIFKKRIMEYLDGNEANNKKLNMLSQAKIIQTKTNLILPYNYKIKKKKKTKKQCGSYDHILDQLIHNLLSRDNAFQEWVLKISVLAGITSILLVLVFGIFLWIYFVDPIRSVGGTVLPPDLPHAWDAFILFNQIETTRFVSLRCHLIEASILFMFQISHYVSFNKDSYLLCVEKNQYTQHFPIYVEVASLIAGVISVLSVIGLWSEISG